MLTLANVSDALILLPLAIGIVLVIVGSRIQRGIALGVASITTILMIVTAVTLAGNVLPVGPQLVTFLSFGNSMIQLRIDGISALLAAGFSVIVTPVLLWMTTPRDADSLSSAVYAKRSMGFALIAVAFTLAAILVDNYFLTALCWAGVVFVGWIMSRADHFKLPTSAAIWGDLAIPALGPLLFALVMLFPFQVGHTQSLLDLTGRGTTAKPLFTFASGLLGILVLGFAAGQYPFFAWIRNLIRGGTSECTAVLLLLNIPIALISLARFATIIGSAWPQVTIGPVLLTLNVVILAMGVLTVLTSGILLLFERDTLSFAGFMATLTTGWFFVAIGLGTDHALLGGIFIILAYLAGIGFFLAATSSLEWAGFDQNIVHLAGIAREHPFHAIVMAFSLLTVIGSPFMPGFAGMSLVNSAMLSLGGLAALGGALMWIGNGFAMFGGLRIIALSWRHIPAGAERYNARRDGAGMIIGAAVLIVAGIAPELLLLPIDKVPGIAQIAAGSLLSSGTDITTITVTALGFGSGATQYLPGLLWIMFLVVGGILALSAGTFSPASDPSPVFTGGSAWTPEDSDIMSLVTPLAALAHSPFILPGPASWRIDEEEKGEGDADSDLVANEDEIDIADIDESAEIVEIIATEDDGHENHDEHVSIAKSSGEQETAPESLPASVPVTPKPASKSTANYAQRIPVKTYPQSTHRSSHKGKKGGSKRHG